MTIVDVRIHPAIGIARVGNSPTDYFVGPERRWERPSPPDNLFKDASHRIKRQAARFHVFAYHDTGEITEVTSDGAVIEWTARLVNSKAAGPKSHTSGLRNAGYTGADRAGLVIDSGNQTVAGPGAMASLGGVFALKGCQPQPVSLGEVRTDEAGRLLVLGGQGTAGSPTGRPVDPNADSDDWYDDVSDGPITATVTIDGTAYAAAGAWCVVCPPKFAPHIDNVVRLWDALFDKLADSTLKSAQPSYVDDIYPILQAANDASAVNANAYATYNVTTGRVITHHHGFVHPVADAAAAQIYARLTSKGATHMPKLYSDDHGHLQLPLTETQLGMVEKWTTDTAGVNSDWTGKPPQPAPDISPDGLDRAALENCVGGPFLPGVEVSDIVLDSARYLPLAPGQPSFRLDAGKINPGDVTSGLPLPWQADFYNCDNNWWPVPRPNQVRPANSAPDDPRVEWKRNADDPASYIAGDWAKLGFVTQQPEGLVETERDL